MHSNEAIGIIGLIFLVIFYIAILVFYGYCMWRIFEKAGRKGWEGIIPIYSSIIMAEIGGKPGWWGALTAIPFFGIIFSVWIWNLFLKRFGKDETWTVLLILFGFIMLPILAFGQSSFNHLNTDDDDIKNIGVKNN